MKEIKFPVMNVRMVSVDKIMGNTYNPNKIAPPEMKLLKKSIEEDGYTQPIVCYYDSEKDMYIVVDGFHRLRCAREYFNLPEVPIVVIDKDIKERKASTIRHNRARGKHGIEPMSDIVADLYIKGWDDAQIASELGMDFDEVLRLKQTTGLAEVFANHEFSKSWESQGNVKEEI